MKGALLTALLKYWWICWTNNGSDDITLMYITANESWYIWIHQEGCLEWCMGDLHQHLKWLVLIACHSREQNEHEIILWHVTSMIQFICSFSFHWWMDRWNSETCHAKVYQMKLLADEWLSLSQASILCSCVSRRFVANVIIHETKVKGKI